MSADMTIRYTNQAASDAHLATQPVQDLIKLFTTSDVLAAPPEVHNCLISAKKTSAPTISLSSNPAIVLTNTPYGSEVGTKVLEGWGKDAENTINEDEGLDSVIVTQDKEGQSVRAQYVWKDWEAWERWAAKGKRHSDDTSGLAEIVKIKGVHGFLGRGGEGSGSKL